MNTIPSSELIINNDNTIFHLHLRPEDLSDTVILVGDPARVSMVTDYFDSIEVEARNREFVSQTGRLGNKRITVLSTGIGTDNIDIVLNELDALANIDFATRTINKQFRQLTILRLGTSGSLQADIPLGALLMSDISVGFDGLLNFYANRDSVSLLDLEASFVKHMDWSKQLPAPYFVRSSEKLIRLFGDDVLHGVTISAPGFYGPQGRVIRLPLHDADLLSKIETFRHANFRITNFEMESSAIAGLSRLLGHEASTICTIIANRYLKDMDTDYKPAVKKMIEKALEKLV